MYLNIPTYFLTKIKIGMRNYKVIMKLNEKKKKR